jgi:glycosyltransferase involved in cell wall biosynthesis
LQVAIRQVLEKNPDIPARFAFQWVEDFTDDAGRTCCLDPWLERNPKVEVIRRYFGEQEYAGFLARTDVMLLPYRLPYQLRVSRVLIEAMLLGLPVVATRGTTLADQAGEFGAAVLCDDGSADSLASAIIEASAEHSALQLLAEKKAQAAGRHFSIAGFRQIIAAR